MVGDAFWAVKLLSAFFTGESMCGCFMLGEKGRVFKILIATLALERLSEGTMVVKSLLRFEGLVTLPAVEFVVQLLVLFPDGCCIERQEAEVTLK